MPSLRRTYPPKGLMPLSLVAVVLIGTVGQALSLRLNRFNRNAEEGGLSSGDEERLSRLYGREMVESHRGDFMAVGQREPSFHPNHPPPISLPDRQQIDREIEQVRLLEHQPLTPSLVKTLLRELLERLEGAENGPGGEMGTVGGGEQTRCSLHGLWLSAITGVAFQLEAAQEHTGLKVQVLDAGGSAEHRIITSEWGGTASVSTVPTTISIILQERLEGPKEPKTAVFVGQCVICSGSPTIQGTWILFPEAQVCFQEGKAPQADVMYLLKR